MEITVSVKNVYGNELIYPADENANLFAELTGKKTFSRWDLNRIRSLGYDVKVLTPTV